MNIFTASDRDTHIRSGDFATVEKIGEDGTLALRLGNGKAVQLSPNQAQHIDYGYAVDTVPRTGMDRILMTGDAAQLAKQQEVFARLSRTSATSPYTHRTAGSLEWRKQFRVRRLHRR